LIHGKSCRRQLVKRVALGIRGDAGQDSLLLETGEKRQPAGHGLRAPLQLSMAEQEIIQRSGSQP
jgi:hypothetical protein